MTGVIDEDRRPDDTGPPATAVWVDVSSRQYLLGYFARVRAGDTGLLPVIIGMIAIAAVFGTLSSSFLTAGNMVNLLVQGSPYMLLGMAAVFVLLLGEVDLSLGYVAGVAGVVCAVLASHAWPWWAACLVALIATAAIGTMQGLIIAIVRVPSFVVTLAGLLGWNGVMLLILGNGGTIPIHSETIFNFANGLLTPAVGWVLYVVFAVVYVLMQVVGVRNRAVGGLAQPPLVIIVSKVAVVLLVGLIVVALCNADRGRVQPIRGVPWVVLIVLGVVLLATFGMSRTRFGRYVYAVGGNAEAARRAGISLVLIRTSIFALAGLTTGIGGLIFASRLGSVSTSFDGGVYVLYAIAAAVIGGTSLFGGRGKIVHGMLGGLIIAGIDNGMGLLSMSSSSKYIVTALVLLAAVSIDAIARRGRTGSGLDA